MHYRTLLTDRDGHVRRRWVDASSPDEASTIVERQAAGRIEWMEITILDEQGHTLLSIGDDADVFGDCEYRA